MSSSQTANSVSGSTLNAGGNINITVTGVPAGGIPAEVSQQVGNNSVNGTNNPNTGNINVTGSQITAAHDVTLTAQNAINLQAAQNTQALDSGFNINVAGNTHLKGAVIDSTLAAQTVGNNQLTTQTLTTESIENKGEYTASSSSVGVSISGSPETGTNNPANGTAGSTLKGGLSGGGGSDSGEAQGTTQSAIAHADITITDEEQQKALTGKTAEETVATLNRDTQHANGSIANP